jgi:sugar lactone lactonase YvrE
VFFVNAASGNISFVSGGKAIPFATGFSGIFTSIGFDASGNLYATDTANGALVRIRPSGERETVAAIPDLRDRPQDITVAPSGDVYALTTRRYILLHISPTGIVEEVAARVLIDPFGIDLAPDGSIYVSRSGSIDVIRHQ